MSSQKSTGNQRSNGEAFEFACLEALHEELKKQAETKVSLITDSYYTKCKGAFNALPLEQQIDNTLAAEAAMREIFPLEPHLMDHDIFTVGLQHDKRGEEADVRDVICVKNSTGWEVGFSCKNNHYALKHPRLSKSIDFGEKWMEHPCSVEYWRAITPLFMEVDQLIEQGANWSEVPEKHERFYVPLLTAFVDELKRIYEDIGEEAPRRMMRYLIGGHDFYKIIANKDRRITEITPFNMNGTLGQSSQGRKSKFRVSTIHLPTKFLDISFKKERNGSPSKTTVIVACDGGWTVSLRLHSASGEVESSLKFDAKLIGQPSAMNARYVDWE